MPDDTAREPVPHDSPFMARATASRRNELTEARDLYDEKLIATPALKEMQAKAVARYQADVEEHRVEKKEEKAAANRAAMEAKEGCAERVNLPEFVKKKAQSSARSRLPTAPPSAKSATCDGTVEEFLNALRLVIESSSTRLRSSGDGESAHAALPMT